MEKEELLKQAQIAYDRGEPIMSDEEFDTLSNDVSQFKSNDSVTYTVKHIHPMGTTNKVHSVENLLKAIPDEVFVQPKFDGISLEIKLVNGEITAMSTRGNQEYGQDMMHLYDRGFLRGVNWSTDLSVVYCELTLSSGEPSQKDRNKVAGIANSNEPSEEDLSKLVVNVYDAYFASGTRVPFASLEGIYISNSLKVIPAKTYLMRKNYEMIENFKDLFDAHYSTTKRDGIIFKNYDVAEGTNFIIALKPSPEIGITAITGVSWKRGKEKFAATALLDPVEIGGVKVSRVTLPTSYIKDMDLHIGDVVRISRRGDVIPKIDGVYYHAADGQPIEEPNTCEYGHELHVVGKSLLCTEMNCKSFIDSFFKKFIEVLFWDVKRAPTRKLVKLYDEGKLEPEDIFDEFGEWQYDHQYLTDREYNMTVLAIKKLKETYTQEHLLSMFNVSGFTWKKMEYISERYPMRQIIEGNANVTEEAYKKYIDPITEQCQMSSELTNFALTISFYVFR